MPSYYKDLSSTQLLPKQLCYSLPGEAALERGHEHKLGHFWMTQKQSTTASLGETNHTLMLGCFPGLLLQQRNSGKKLCATLWPLPRAACGVHLATPLRVCGFFSMLWFHHMIPNQWQGQAGGWGIILSPQAQWQGHLPPYPAQVCHYRGECFLLFKCIQWTLISQDYHFNQCVTATLGDMQSQLIIGRKVGRGHCAVLY